MKSVVNCFEQNGMTFRIVIFLLEFFVAAGSETNSMVFEDLFGKFFGVGLQADSVYSFLIIIE